MRIILNYEQDLHLKGKSVEILFQNTMSSYEDMILVQKSSSAGKCCMYHFPLTILIWIPDQIFGISSEINKPRVFMLVSLLAPVHIISTIPSECC